MLRAIFLSTVLVSLSTADNRQAAALVARMEARYHSARTLQATFLERYSDNGRTLRNESGIAYFRRPGKMRWQYEAPENDLFLVDGKSAWFYVPADHTVTRVPAKQSTDFRTPLALLAGEMKVSRACSRVELAFSEKPSEQGNAVLQCTLRGAEDSNAGNHNPDLVFFEIVPDSGELSRILVRQSDGVEIEFRFTHWQFDPPLTASMFHFDVPAGVAIVRGEGAPGEHDAR